MAKITSCYQSSFFTERLGSSDYRDISARSSSFRFADRFNHCRIRIFTPSALHFKNADHECSLKNNQPSAILRSLVYRPDSNCSRNTEISKHHSALHWCLCLEGGERRNDGWELLSKELEHIVPGGQVGWTRAWLPRAWIPDRQLYLRPSLHVSGTAWLDRAFRIRVVRCVRHLCNVSTYTPRVEWA